MISTDGQSGALTRSGRRSLSKKDFWGKPSRHGRLLEYARLAKEVESVSSANPSKAVENFKRARELFFAEGWTVNHFQSVESKALLLDTIDAFWRLSERLEAKNGVARTGRPKPAPCPSSHRIPQAYRSKKKTGLKRIEVVFVVLIIIVSAVLVFVFA